MIYLRKLLRKNKVKEGYINSLLGFSIGHCIQLGYFTKKQLLLIKTIFVKLGIVSNSLNRYDLIKYV